MTNAISIPLAAIRVARACPIGRAITHSRLNLAIRFGTLDDIGEASVVQVGGSLTLAIRMHRFRMRI